MNDAMTAVHSQHKTLTELLDLSLKTPEVGAVNFRILHQLLAQVLQHVGLAEKTTVINNDTNLHQHKGPSVVDLNKKVHNIEERLKILNSFPSPKEIFEKSQGESIQNAAVSTFQSIQLKKSVEANEAGVTKSLGLIDEILDEMNNLKRSNEEMQQKLDESVEKLSSEVKELKETSIKMEEQLDKKGKHLEKMAEFIDELPKLEEFDQFVTWPVVAQALVTGTLDEKTFKEAGTHALEKLGGVFKRVDQLEEKIKRYENENSDKADKKDFEQIKRVVMEQINHRTRGASISLQDQIDNLTEQVTQITGTRDNETNALTSLQNSITGVESKIKGMSLDITSIADGNREYQKKIDKLFSSFETLNKEKANDRDIQKLIENKVEKTQLLCKVDQKDFENKAHEISDKFMDVMQRMNNNGDEWREIVKKLTDEIETKLDRTELDQIKKQLEKRLGVLRKMVDDTQERFGSKMQGDNLLEGDEAAGLRRQLINYNCISCNRPIDVKHPFTPSYAYPSIPNGGEFPYNRTTRPYTTFELDQIRNHAKGAEVEDLIKCQATNYKLAVEEREFLRLRQIDEIARQISCSHAGVRHISFQGDELDPLYHGRSCGGNYTMSYPQKGTKYTRLTHISELWQQDDLQNRIKNESNEERPPAEVDLLGENGQIYRGRLPGLKKQALQNQQIEENNFVAEENSEKELPKAALLPNIGCSRESQLSKNNEYQANISVDAD